MVVETFEIVAQTYEKSMKRALRHLAEVRRQDAYDYADYDSD